MNQQNFTLKSFFSLIVFSTFFSNANAQFCGNVEDKKPAYYDSLGIIRKLRVMDRFGNEYTTNDVAVQAIYDKLASLYPVPFGGDSTAYTPFVPSYTCNAGLFKVHFAGDTAGFGLHIPKNREIICQVFKDISRLIFDVNPSKPNRVNIWVSSDTTFKKVRPSSQIPANAAAFASSFIVSPELASNFFTESLVSKTIRLGYDSREEYPKSLLSGEFMHGLLVINFGQILFDTSYRDTVISANKYDLYSTVLHEAFHLLGMFSTTLPNGTSTYNNNVYTQLDKFLIFGDDSTKKLLNLDGNYNLAFNSSFSNTNRGCADNNTVKFFGKNLKRKLMHNPTNYAPASSLSHFGCSENSSCANFINSLSQDVMNFCKDKGKDYIKRKPSMDEVKLLCDLGFELNSIGGVIAYGADTTNFTSYKTYSNPCISYCNVLGGFDTFDMEADKTSITIKTAQLLANDRNTTSIRDFKAVGSNGAVIKSFKDSFVIYAGGNHSSEYLICSYIPFCSDTTIMGTKTFVFVKLSVNTQPLCDEGDDCNLICKGDFEGSFNIRRLNYPEKIKYYGSNSWTSPSTDLFYRNCFDNSKLCQRAGGNKCTGDTNCGFSVTNYKLPPNNGSQHAGTRHGNLPGTYESELINFFLKKPLLPGKQYLMRFKVRRNTHFTALDFKVLVAGDSVKPCLNNFTDLTGGISDCGFKAQRIDRKNFLVKKNDTNWITMQDTLAPVSHKIQHIIVIGDTFIRSSNSVNFTGIDFAYINWDDFEITELNTANISLKTFPSNVSPCINNQTHSITYRICADSADLLDSLKLTIDLPSEMIVQSNSHFQLNQTLKIPKDSLKMGMCVERKLYYKLNPSFTIPNQDLKVKLRIINSTTCFTTNEESTVTIKPIAPPITLIKSADKQNPNLYDTITYTITVCNNGSDSISTIQFRDTIKPELWLIDNGNFTLTGNVLTRNYNIGKAYSSISPRCISDNYKALVENSCPFENCAYAQHSTIACINAKSCVSTNAAKRDSIKITANKPRLCIGDTIILEVKNWKQYGDYSWWDLNGVFHAITSDSIIKITAGGKYMLKFERQFGCTLYDSIIIPIDTPPSISKSITAAFCDNTNGAINITVFGGKKPYSYLWENTSTNEDRTGLTEGRYIVRVVDSLSCSKYDTSYVQRQSSGMALSHTVTVQPNCMTSTNGQVTISASSGVSPYTFLWNDGSTSQNRTGLSAGPYWVRVKDARNCFDTLKFVLNPVSNLTVKIDTSLPCNRDRFILKAEPSAGTAPYTYQWTFGYGGSGNNPTAQTVNVLYTLNYWHKVVVTDASGCTTKDSFFAVQPDSILLIQWQPTRNLTGYMGAGKEITSTLIQDKVITGISNILNIDTSITFERCVIIPSFDELNIESNIKLTLHDCRIRTCIGLGWKGFRLRDGAEIELVRDTLEDAYVGVNVEGSATLGIQHTLFINNGIGLYFKPLHLNQTSKSVQYSLPFIGNKFIGVGTMKSFNMMESIGGNYLKLNQSDWIANPIKISGSTFYPMALGGFSNQSKPLAGIVMFNTENLMHGLGTKASDRIYFENLQYGFVAQDVRDVFLNNISIKDIDKIAIVSELSEVYNQNNFIPSYFIPGLFGTNIAHTTIQNAIHGIFNWNTSLGVYHSNISGVSRGITSQLFYSNAVGVENTSISASLKGIHSTHAGLIPSYNFKKNVIVINGTSYQAEGIAVHSAVNPGARVFSPIEENTVELRGKANFAYAINSLKGNNYLVKNNTAKMMAFSPNTSNTSYYKGGFNFSNSQVDAISNTAYSYNRTALNPDFLPAHYPVGMSYAVTDGVMACNNLNNIRTGTLFSADCKGAKFRKNKFNNHFTGLKIDNFSRLDTQINAGNTWIGSYTGGNPVLNMQMPSLTFFMANPSSPSRFRPTNTVPSGFIVLNSGNDNDACTGDWKNRDYMVSVFGGVQSGDVQIMQGSISYNAFNSFLTHQDEQQLYAELKPFEYEFVDSSLEKLFIQSMEASGAGSGDNFVELSHEEQLILNLTQEQNNQITIWKRLIDSSYRQWPLLDSAYHEATDSATKAERKEALEANHAMRREAQIAFYNFMTSYKAGNQTDWTSLVSENNSIVPTILTDTFQRRFNAIYYTSFAQENPNLDSTQKATIRYLAHQCPLINHDVVYRSRAIMAAYEDTLTYDDYTICMESGYEHKSTREQSRQIMKPKPLTCSLSPNPTKDIAKLWFSAIPADKVSISITDLQGRILHNETKTLQSNVYIIDVSRLNEGIYIVSVMSNEKTILNAKLQILK